MTKRSEERADEGGKGGGGRGYFARSKDLLTSLVLVLPLLLVYQAGVLATRGATLNGADFMTVVVLRRWDWDGLLVFNGALILLGVAGVLHLRRRGGFDPGIVGWVAVESTFYALLLGFVITSALRQLGIAPPHAAILAAGPPVEASLLARVCMALGAGVNEELVFRLGLYSSIAALLQRPLGKERAVLAGVLLSSVLFSLAHYLGPEQFQVYTFVYRALAGALFCGVFWARGLAVAVYTHAIYDVIVMVILPG